MSNNLEQRLAEHYFNRGKFETFAGRYFCYNLIYFEEYPYVYDAIAREKELKGWSRIKKENLVNTKNPTWTFMNKTVCIHWPPKENRLRF